MTLRPDWMFVREFTDADGHLLRVLKARGRDTVLIEVGPCPACAALARYVLGRDQWEQIMLTAFVVELPNPN